MGESKNINIRFEKILSLIPQISGIEIEKETIKSALIQLPDKTDMFSIILDRLIREKELLL